MINVRIPKASPHDFSELRDGLAECIKATGTGARVHNNWAMYSTLDETLQSLTNADKLIHAWMVGIKGIDVRNTRAGGAAIEMPLTIAVNGYIGYRYGTDSVSRQAILERECRDIIKIFYLNKGIYGMENVSARDSLATVDDNEQFLTFNDISVQGFGSKDTVLIAEGTMTIVWKEYIQEA